jgi:hypothetical protein
MDQSIKTQLPRDKSLSGVFTDISSGERAYGLLREMGYVDDVSVLLSDEARVRYFPSPGLKGEVVGDTEGDGPGFGSIIGIGAGAAIGALLAAAACLAIPGPGVVIIGPLAAVLIGAILGGLSGSLIGSLLGIGYSEQDAKKSEEKVRQGNVIIGINPRSEEDAEKISREWQAAGGEIVIQKQQMADHPKPDTKETRERTSSIT